MTAPTEKEKADAMAWLDGAISELADGGSFLCTDYSMEGDERPYLATLRAMLAEPRLPEEINYEARQAALSALGIGTAPGDLDLAGEAIRLYHNHLHRILSAPPKPKTKTVEVKAYAVLSPDGQIRHLVRSPATPWLHGSHQAACEEDQVIELTGSAKIPA